MDIIIGGFIAGAFAASDFSRYAGSNAHNWAGTLPGTFLISFLLGVLGMLSVAATGHWNPVLVVQDIGLGVSALVFILLANWTTSANLLYSSGLARGEEIPLECRILAIADAYDAMTCERPYRKALPRREAVEELKRCAGIQFDRSWCRCL